MKKINLILLAMMVMCFLFSAVLIDFSHSTPAGIRYLKGCSTLKEAGKQRACRQCIEKGGHYNPDLPKGKRCHRNK
jgi:hypothetical protein